MKKFHAPRVSDRFLLHIINNKCNAHAVFCKQRCQPVKGSENFKWIISNKTKHEMGDTVFSTYEQQASQRKQNTAMSLLKTLRERLAKICL